MPKLLPFKSFRFSHTGTHILPLSNDIRGVVLEADTPKLVEWLEGSGYCIITPQTSLVPYYVSRGEITLPLVDGEPAGVINIQGLQRATKNEAGFYLMAEDPLVLSISFFGYDAS